VGLRGCPRPIEWSTERQDGEQEQEHEVGPCDSVVEYFFRKIAVRLDSPYLQQIAFIRKMPANV
jgi:hypothetical protein